MNVTVLRKEEALAELLKMPRNSAFLHLDLASLALSDCV
jgi:hypothetical protein